MATDYITYDRNTQIYTRKMKDRFGLEHTYEVNPTGNDDLYRSTAKAYSAQQNRVKNPRRKKAATFGTMQTRSFSNIRSNRQRRAF